MLRLVAVQAEEGDCLLVEFGTAANPRYVLIDGGPAEIYERHLRGELERIAGDGGKLELVVLSHVDNDHVIGLLDLLADIEARGGLGAAGTIGIDRLWHNSFAAAEGSGTDIAPRMRTLLGTAGMAHALGATGFALAGIQEGDGLRRLAKEQLQIPLNPDVPGGLICVEDAPAPLTLGNLTLRVVGPTRANLDALKGEWLEWLKKQEDAVESGDPVLTANSDRSIPNLSSITLLATADGKSMLLTGDARSDHLLQGLAAADALDAEGKLHLDVMKVAHHGSNRNATKRFFRTVTADTYVLSANGKDDNPDLATLIWIVEAARDQNRRPELVLTNETPSIVKLLEEYDPAEVGYRATIMPRTEHTIAVELAP